MGYYINSEKETKEKWLINFGRRIPEPLSYETVEKVKCIVCLMGGHFSAAEIIYNQDKLDELIFNGDRRSREWFLVSRKDAIKVSNIKAEDFQ